MKLNTARASFPASFLHVRLHFFISGFISPTVSCIMLRPHSSAVALWATRCWKHNFRNCSVESLEKSMPYSPTFKTWACLSVCGRHNPVEDEVTVPGTSTSSNSRPGPDSSRPEPGPVPVDGPVQHLRRRDGYEKMRSRSRKKTTSQFSRRMTRTTRRGRRTRSKEKYLRG